MGDLGNRIRRGALLGIEVLLWYALSEYVLLAVSLLIRPHRVMMVQQWRGTVVLFACYIVLGAFIGMATSLAVTKPDPKGYRLRRAITFVALILFALNVAIAACPVPNKLALLGATLVVILFLFFNTYSVQSDGILRKEVPFAFGTLVCSGWMVSSERVDSLGTVERVALVMGCMLILLLVVALLTHVLESWESRFNWLCKAATAAKWAIIFVMVFGPNIISSRAEGTAPTWPVRRTAISQPPNIVLITLDTVAAGHMGIYGYPRANTPNLQNLLKEATFYTNCIAVAPLTLTSHASIFTGLYPQSHGSYKGFTRFPTGRPLDPRIPTLAQLLSANGYRTMAVAANRYYLTAEFGTLRGFGLMDWLAPTVLVAPERDYLLRSRLRQVLRFDAVVRDLDQATITAEEVNRRAFELLDQQPEKDPFFLFLNYTDAHMPYLPPPPFNTMYPGRDLGFDLKQYSDRMMSVNEANRPLDAKSRDHLVSQYDGSIAYLDSKIGELIARLKRDGQYDRTMLIITSDHGEAFGDRNIVFHDGSVYENQVHIPLIVKYPHQTQAARLDVLTSHVDLMPTILTITGTASPAPLQGIDLQKLTPETDRVVVAEMHGSTNYLTQRFQQIEYALYSGRLKMIYSDKGMRELYDLSTDPMEHHNLYRPNGPYVAELRNKLINWSRLTTPRYLDAGPADREIEKRLESLGYAHHGGVN